MSTVDIEDTNDVLTWIRRDATINDLHVVASRVQAELEQRTYVCAECGREIPTALPRKHPAHTIGCTRYTSMVTY